MASWDILQGDCLEVMPTLAEASVDAIVCDPPYGLSFMGRAWDHGVPGEPFWREALRVAKPGAYLVAAGGTRTFHRLACAIEDAGWEMRDCLSWLYGSGFPKGKACLKPAWEPMLLARKPAKHSAPLNIDGCRIEGTPDRPGSTPPSSVNGQRGSMAGSMDRVEYDNSRGRWPANVVLDEEAAGLLDAQTGTLTSGKMRAGTTYPGGNVYGAPAGETKADTIGDSGGASRFYYCAKASRKERGEGNNHPTVKPLALMRWLCRLVTPAGGLILDPFTGSGTTGCAAALEGFRFLGIEQESDYCEIARRRIEHWAAA